MKNLILSLVIVICFSTVAKAEELITLELDSAGDVYLDNHSLKFEYDCILSLIVLF